MPFGHCRRPPAFRWLLAGLLLMAGLAQATDVATWERENDAAVAAFRAAATADSPDNSRALLQRALDTLDALLAGPAPDAASLRRARFDRVVVLAALGRNEEALSAARGLEAEGEAVPAYVLSSAGDAAAGLELPEVALARYEEALRLEPEMEAAHAGRIFALADLDRLDAAERILRDRLAAPAPQGVTRRDRLRLALVLGWRGELDEALRRGQALLDEDVREPEFLIQQGGLLLQADRPRAALTRYDAALALAPGNRRAAVGRAQALDRLGRWQAADAAFAGLDREDAGWRPLARALREREADRAAQLSWMLGAAQGPDRELAGQEWQREARLTSRRSDFGWRGFVGLREAEAEYQGRSLLDRRQFAGASLQRGDWRLRGEVNRADDRFSDQDGWALEADWRPTDAWSFSLGYADTAFDLPLRGRELGTVGDRWSLAARWQPRAQHWVRAGAASTRFSDGNRGDSLSLGSQHRFAWGRRAAVVLAPSLHTLRNSREDVPYFSPERALSLELGGALEQRLWLRPGRKLAHALEFGAGQQRQAGFSPVATGRLGYRLEWDPSPGRRFYLRLVRARRAYDGVPEYQTRLEFGGWWSLR